MAPNALPPAPAPPLIPESVLDAPTQRLYLASVLGVVQLKKLSELLPPGFLSLQPVSPVYVGPARDAGLDPNWTLVKWIAIDLALVAATSKLRVPRLTWSRRGLIAAFVALAVFDYLLFGRYEFSWSLFTFLLPATLKSIVERYKTTTEQSVRISKVLGTEQEHLGGTHTVHVLAVSTAQLSPAAGCYCIPSTPQLSHSRPAAIHIPLHFNNTTPSLLTYSLTSLDDPSRVSFHNLTVAELAVSTPKVGNDAGRDEAEYLDAVWGAGGRSPSSGGFGGAAKYHELPLAVAGKGEHGSSGSSLNQLVLRHPAPASYYLTLTSPGFVRLEAAWDSDGLPIRIRQKMRQAGEYATAGNIRVVGCPTAGFAAAPETHRCLSGSGKGGLSAGDEESSLPLELVVKGLEPLAVRWHETLTPFGGAAHHSGHGKQRTPDRITRDEYIEGIRRPANTEEDIIRVPVNVSLTAAGTRHVYLDSITDGCGNSVVLRTLRGAYEDSLAVRAPEKESTEALAMLVEALPSAKMTDVREFVVHPPPEVSFTGSCARGAGEVKLLKGKTATLELQLVGVEREAEAETLKRRAKASAGAGGGAAHKVAQIRDKLDQLHERAGREETGRPALGRERDGLWTVDLKFTPDEGSSEKGWTREFDTWSPQFRINVDAPGTYEIVGVDGRWCEGAVLVPNICTVVLQPEPTVSMSFEPIVDSCRAETGLVTHLHFTGAPPFTVHYMLQQTSPVVRTQHLSKRVARSHEQIRIEPGPGDWSYRFVRIEDANYNNIGLPKGADFAFSQAVNTVASARWKDAERGKRVRSCEGETVSVDVELVGSPPWSIEFSVLGEKRRRVDNILVSPHNMEVPIPSSVAKRGGPFSLSLESVTDSTQCRRQLNTEDLAVDVRRNKPTARFHGIEGKRSVVVRQGEKARIPLRLTGEAPWTVTYTAPKSGAKPLEFVARQPNVDLSVDGTPGQFTLLSVHDRYCPGVVSEPHWGVSTIEKPWLRLAPDAGKLGGNGIMVRPAVCQGVEDQISINFGGKAPFKASYDLIKHSTKGEKQPRTLQAIQSSTTLALFTGEAGHHSYVFRGVSDSIYSHYDAAGLIAQTGGQAGRLRVEQDVHPAPSAAFKHTSNGGFCVTDELRSRGKNELIVALEGRAPFELELEVSEEGQRGARRHVVQDIEHTEWALDLPEVLQRAARHSVVLRRVRDANGCETQLDGRSTTATISVAEVASITPVHAQSAHCVGDFLDFVVQGSPPFTVTYEFDGKRHNAPVNSPRFSRLASAPGVFKIHSVSHGDDRCKSNTVNLQKAIYQVPKAAVAKGTHITEDRREGDLTEIIFTFQGEPPFTFTYSRRHPQDRSKDRTVLETHTVTDVREHQYSIFSSQEGTWSVSYIADAHCSYPPAAPADALVKA